MSVLWVSAILVPVLTVAALGLAGLGGARSSEKGREFITKYAALALLPFGALALLGPRAGPIELPWLLLGTHLTVDDVGRPLLLVAVLLYAAALIATYSSRTERAPVLAGFLLASFLGNALVFVAADTVTFYLGFTVMSLSAYGLVIHEGTAAAVRAGRIYIVLTLLGEMATLAALMMVVDAGGMLLADAPSAVAESGHTELIVLLLLVGFGVKAGTVPLHVWLPLAHPAAPPPASAVLSGTMIKAGLVGWLRFLPLGEVAMPGWGQALVVLALVGAFAALVPGLLQNDTKVALAYSSISQMGFLAVLVGAALAEPEIASACVLAAVVYAVHHGMAKGGLFLGVTVWRTHGDGWVRWWVIGGLCLLALAVAGAPFGSGAVAKYAAKEAIEPVGLLGVELADLLPLVGTVSTLLLLRAGWLLLTGSRDRAWGVDGALLSWSVLIVGGTVLTWLLAVQWTPLISVPSREGSALWDASWPILLGLGLAVFAWSLTRWNQTAGIASLVRRWTVPPGDLLVPEERLARSIGGAVMHGTEYVTGRSSAWAAGIAATTHRIPPPMAALENIERRLASWTASGIVVLLLGGAMIVMVVLR
ncbi:proton-conducting transporter transmembrane domain-containing protein [Hoyosella subflava]|uniref:Formate hydrogenlyase subunit 3/multisubunit Na+/H+ antiporter, MnhD subunit n=1 Tax=Hoyosella subflava (strain DSM 45089 / JCM 17490 / NBRC 109087 / DQS3-9A1) TaxID=443218 RepID=F6EIU2_HOYSD|nr:proton-conducting transporter membrane subunit [Hoyosella subflava]AEF40003.1 Formate hydrogenlyase subunit 3/multisubunit Na+/H+ antiporter, MnhD subunit [Hoyosella subflava DQS3-9A1]